jgi:hypothetical protein
VKAIEVPCPALDVQQDVVDHITAALRAADEMDADLRLLLGLASDTRTALFRDAFSGRLATQDPMAEPAAEALERARAKQAAAPKRRSRPRTPAAA